MKTSKNRPADLMRRGVGIELNSDYFRDGLGYLQEAEAERDAPTLFDLMEEANGERIKADTWYMLQDGEFVEATDDGD